MQLTGRLFGGVIVLILFCRDPGLAAAPSELDAAIERGLGWVTAYPATSGDGGLPDMVDEGLFYLTVNRLSSGAHHERGHRRAFEESVSRLAGSPVFERWVKKPDKTLLEHYHLLLATHLIEGAGKPLVSRNSVIEEAQRTLASSRFENPTFRLAVALLLQHLGAEPQADIDVLLDASLINHVARRGALPFEHLLAYYALVHEVAALTDFGRIRVSPWLMERRESIAGILQEGARRAMASAHIDLLAEIFLCNHMLGLAVTADLRLGVDFLVASQRADGSWGEQATPRFNRRRHAVQTATAALMAYRASLSGQCAGCDSP